MHCLFLISLNTSFFCEKFSPLDQIIDELGGPDTVAEMTGRRGRMVRRHGNAKPQYELRGVEADSAAIESLNVREVSGTHKV